MSEAVIGFGSNLGNGRDNINEAWSRLGAFSVCSLLALSSPYFTKPICMESKHWFTNAVGRIKTSLHPKSLLEILLQIEADMGRERIAGSSLPSDRKIDLDLIYYDDLVFSAEDLIVPHPAIQNRLFVLAPLDELLPDRIHPVLGQTSSQMLMQLKVTDALKKNNQLVKKMTW